ncbi:MAG: deoxyribose-phosphate aldolase [Clostridia bacterium]|nr:deoxyribose-phosphate aldolase [Clostridia bacterium]
MNLNEILSRCDHTLLAVDATWEDIKAICDDGIRFHTASVCIPPAYVKEAKNYVKDQLAICTVIGFPNGYNSTAAKVFETKDAIESGADEIDIVIAIGRLKAKEYDYVRNEIKEIKKACGDKILKVIIETCLLTEEEKTVMCRLVTEAGADYIKTSTGFSKAGATREDVALMHANVGEAVKVKAAGGIASIKDAEDMIALGADRLGTSRIVKLAKANLTESNPSDSSY